MHGLDPTEVMVPKHLGSEFGLTDGEVPHKLPGTEGKRPKELATHLFNIVQYMYTCCTCFVCRLRWLEGSNALNKHFAVQAKESACPQ